MDNQPLFKPADKIAGEYTVIRELGRGTHSQVYHCTYDRTGQEVAVKVLHREQWQPENLKLLREEARRWVELGIHRNIIAAWNIDQHARLPCIVIEYAPGVQSLAELCVDASRRNRALGWQIALSIAGQVACGLNYAWTMSQLLHRDIKPGNILITGAGLAKVTDFRLAVAKGSEHPTDEIIVGTPPYMAPELWDGQFSGTAADVYALGITVFEITSGHWPFSGWPVQSLGDFRECHSSAPTPDVRLFAPDIPPDFAHVIGACMAKEPERRPQTFADLLIQLESIGRRELGGNFNQAAPDVTIAEPDRLTNVSSMHHQLGNSDEARKYAERAVRLAPASANARMALGNALGLAGDFKGAMLCHKKALELDPTDDARRSLLCNLAKSAFELGDEHGGRIWLRQAIRAAETLDQLGELDDVSFWFTKLPPEEALYLCDRVIAANPSAAITWNNRAIICRRNRQYEEAERSARQAIQLNPLYAKAWANLANALLNQERIDEVITAARHSLNIDPMTAGAYAALMNAYREKDEIRTARAIIEEGARVLPRHPLIQQALKLARSRRFEGLYWNSPG